MLLSLTSNRSHQTCGYNAIGNIATSSSTGNYIYAGTNYANPHAVTTTSTTTNTAYVYDYNGNLITTTDGNTSWHYSWDYGNRLTQAGNGSATTTFAYDYQGTRVRLGTGGATTTYLNRHYNLQSTGVGPATTTKHIYVADQLIATVVGTGEATSSYIVHTDHLGGTNMVTNASGTVVELADYYPYGEARLDQGSYSEQRKFTGTEFDSGPTLSYMQNRYYSGTKGQFLSQDPLVNAIGGKISSEDNTLTTDGRKYSLGSGDRDIVLSTLQNGSTFQKAVGMHSVADQQKEDMQAKVTESLLADPQVLNTYSYAKNNPIRLVDPSGLIGVGWIPWDSSAEAGLGVVGAGQNTTVGTGVFWSNDDGFSRGSFLSTGYFLGGPGYEKSSTPSWSDDSSLVSGAYAGKGSGFYFTTAENVGDLGGSGQTFSLNLSLISIQVTIGDNGKWMLAVTAGPGLGTSGSNYPSFTITDRQP